VLGAVLAFLVLFVAAIGGATLAGLTLGVDPVGLEAGDDPLFDQWLTAWALPIQAAFLALLVWRVLGRLGGSPRQELGLVPATRWWAIALVVPAGLVADRVTSTLQLWVPGSELGSLASLAELPGAPGVLGLMLFAGLVILGPVGEELLFRGLVLRGLLADGSALRAIVLSALMFGLFHFDPVHAAGAFVLGLYLGWVRLFTGSLVPAVLAHVVNNGLWYLLVVLGRSGGGTPWWADLIGLVVILGVVWTTRDALSEMTC
jgi:membrane protease YdiL (CAAX protease family)